MPSALQTVVESLSFRHDRRRELRNISPAEWRRLLALTDKSQLTLPLGVRCRDELPQWVRERTDGNLRNNAIRCDRVLDAYQEVARALSSAGVEFVVLKGLTQWPNYCDDLRYRPQYDLDLFCPPHAIEPAHRAIQSLGYEPFGSQGRIAIDHLPPMIRKTGWRPRGDYYDPEMPLTVELHFRFWDEGTERFGVEGAEEYWGRHVNRWIQGLSVPALHRADALSYSAWHLIRHLVRGDVRAYHVYELAQFLHSTAEDEAFWRGWRSRKSSALVEAIAFRLAIEWFECDAHPVVHELFRSLPSSVIRWFDLFSWSPLSTWERPNKDELFLHWCLVEDWRARLQITRRRLFPLRFNPIIVDAHVPVPDWRLRLKRRVLGPWFMARRSFHHARTIAPLAWNSLLWGRALATSPPPKAHRKRQSENAAP